MKSFLVRSKIKKSSLLFASSLLLIVESLVAFAIYNKFHIVTTSIVGPPLLYSHGSHSLEIQLFVAFQIVLLPVWVKASKILNSSFYQARKELIYEYLRGKELANYKFSRILFVIVSIYFSTEALFSRSQIFKLHPILPLLFILIFGISFFGLVVFLPNITTALSKLKINEDIFSLILFFLSGLTFFEKFHFYKSRLALNMIILIGVLAFVYFLSIWLLKRFFSNKHRYDLRNVFVNLPIFCFIIYSRVTGPISLHPFESFSYANLRLFHQGFFPWKDFSAEHGIWEDLLRPYLGGILVKNTDWGSAAGIAAVIKPLEYTVLAVGIYLVCKRLSLTLALISVNALFEQFAGLSAVNLPRMIFLIPLIVCLRWYLALPTRLRLGWLGCLSGIVLLMSPEGIYAIAATGLVLVFSSWNSLRRAQTYFIYTTSFCLVFLTPLLSSRLVGAWFHSFLSDSNGYLLSWGGSFQFNLGFIYCVFFLVVPFVCLGVLSQTFNSMGKINEKSSLIWLTPLLVACFAYYIKFLQWPDWHLGQSISLLLMFLLLYFASKIRETKEKILVATFLLLAPLIATSFVNAAADIHPFEGSTVVSGIGPVNTPTNTYVTRLMNVQKSFSNWISPERTKSLFDFANEPVSWYDVLGFKPSGGQIKVLNLYSPATQQNLLSRFKANPPSAVIWGGEFGYWDWPFNGNWMRQYLISSYILNHYTPVAADGKYVLMMPKSRFKPSPIALKVLDSVNCDWIQGASRFVTPEMIHPRSAVVLPANLGNGQASSVAISIPANTRGFEIYPGGPADITMRSSEGSGIIHFSIPKISKPATIWLDQCPVLHYSTLKSRWNIETVAASSIKLGIPK
jgi:hypothetical protein